MPATDAPPSATPHLQAVRATWPRLVLALLGCAGTARDTPTAPTPPTPPPSVVRQVVPSVTDAAIDVANDPHVAINPSPSGAARGKLNSTAVGVLCGDDTDAECFWDVRREVITGTNTSPRLVVTPANAIVNRLARLLQHLHATYPTEGWGQFLAAGNPDWSRVTLAGHSQGGGHVGVLAKLVVLDRAVYFSSPADWRQVANVPATWLARPNVTPASRQYAFIHEQDQLVPEAQARANWVALGLDVFGAVTNVDAASAPYGGSHRLTTRATPALAASFHGATVVDAATPRATSGAPLFEGVWGYLAIP